MSGGEDVPRQPRRVMDARGWQIVAAALAAVAVALAVTLLVTSSSDSSSSSTRLDTADQTLTLACALLDQVPDRGFDLYDNFVLGDKVQLAAALASMAHDQDPHITIWKTLMGPSNATALSFKADDPAFVAALSKAKNACRNR